jgi:glutathione S-transferase
MIEVHHLENSRSQRILWMLEELRLDYTIKHYKRDPKTMLAPKELKAVHPLGKSPVITDDGVVIAETGAIIEYLSEKVGILAPERGTPDYLRYRYWLHYGEGSAMPPLLLKLVFDILPTRPMPFFVRPIAKGIAKGALESFVMPQISAQLDYLESELGKNTWFVGEALSGADIMMSFPLEAIAARSGLGKKRKKLNAFLARIHDRPAYQQALEKGGEYSILGQKKK